MKQCESMPEVREEIDRMDRAIVELLTERLEYIRQAGHVKDTRDTVRDEARVEDVVAKVRAKAGATGLDQDLVEELYRLLIERCIQYEFRVFDDRSAGDKLTA